MGRKRNPSLQEYMATYQLALEKQQQKRTTQKTKAKLRYNQKNYSSLQVFLEPELVSAFKIKVKEMGCSQAEIIRSFVEEFLNNN